MKGPTTYTDTLFALRHGFAQMAQWGCRGFDCSDKALAILETWSRPASSDEPSETLVVIRNDMGECRRCGLCHSRTELVYGEGNPSADLVFVGTGPGLDEDREGRPFVGPAGELLTRIIEAMKLTREQVYVCHVVKCYPPGGRPPEPGEIQTCRSFLARQLAVIQPKVICTLGTCAVQALLDTTMPLSQLRGRFHDYNGIKLMPTFHPADLLQNPDQKRMVWEDIKKIMALLRIPI